MVAGCLLYSPSIKSFKYYHAAGSLNFFCLPAEKTGVEADTKIKITELEHCRRKIMNAILEKMRNDGYPYKIRGNVAMVC